MDAMRFVAVTSSNPAKLFNLYPKKGRIAAGADADIVVWDPSAKQKLSSKTHMSAADMNIFEGQTCHGLPIVTVCGGRVAFEGGKSLAASGSGKFVALPPHCPHLFSVIHQRERVCLPEKVQRTDAPAGGGGGGGGGESRIAAKQVTQQNTTSYGRPPTSAGTRNQFDASVEDSRSARASTKISQPPGGKTSGLW
uniref:Amidohydrolase-related domain-containing protein n=1 Tax=Plectus sambesii TaxID=2011161 RepID=A0A914VC17_9BILA